MRNKFVRAFGGVAIAALIAGTGACASSNTGGGDSADKCGFKIGFFGALTGGNAQLGINIRDGASLAVDQYNAKHKDCTVELKSFDSEGSPDKAPGLAQEVVKDAKLLGTVGPAFSGESKVANPILSAAGVVIVTPSATNPALSQQGWKTFHRALGNDASQGPAAARYIKNVVKAQKVFVIDDASEYGKGLADQVKATLGSAVVKSAVIQEKQTDFSAVVTDIKGSGADAIFLGGYVREAAPLLKQIRAGGVTAKFIAGDGVKEDVLITGAGAEAAEGAILTCPCTPTEKAKGTFINDYKTKTSREPSTYSAEAFDAANILLAGIGAGNTTRAKLNDFVGAYSGEGVTTKFKFQPNGEIDPSSVAIWAYTVKGGKIVTDQLIPGS